MKLDEKSPSQRRDWMALVSAYGRGKPATTLERARTYLEVHPEDGAAWLIAGDVLCEIARYDEAAKALRKAMKLLPPWRLDAPCLHMGHLYREKGNLRAAERWYRKSVAANPKLPRNLIFLGAVLAKQGRFKEAKRCHRRAIGLGIDEADEAYYNLGLILRAEADYEGALKCFDEALHLDPKYTVAKGARRDVLGAIQLRGKR